MSQTTMEHGRRARLWGGPLPHEPSEILTDATEPLTARRQAQWIWAFLAVGVAARVVRYVLRFPLWEDESFLSMNYIGGSYLGMLEPMSYHTVCPLLFSWVQLTMIKVFGFSEYSLRLFPLACGLGSLFVFRHLAGRLLRGTTLVLAVAMFAASYPIMRYVAEAKPYGCDLFVSLILMTLTVEWWRRPQEHRWLWVMAALAPLAVGLSYPAAFVGGGLSLVMAARLWKSADRRAWIAWAAYNASLVSSFGVVFAISIRPKLDAQLTTMCKYWDVSFPPLTQPLKLLGWLVTTHTGSMLAYPVGGPGFGSTLTFLCCVLAAVVLWRRRQFLLLGMTCAPLALNFAAAAMHRYPYGEHFRMALYMAPMFCTLVAIGLAAVLAWHARRRAASATPAVVLLSILMVVLGSSIVRDFWSPYKSATDLRACSFARWFWFSMSHNGEIVCLHSDLKTDLEPEVFQHGNSAVYLCNQRIYSPRHARGEAPQWDRISADWPLRCVQFRAPSIETDEAAIARWLDDMQSRYRLVARETYPFPFYGKRGKDLRFTDYVEVYKFVPKTAAGDEHATAQRPGGEVAR